MTVRPHWSVLTALGIAFLAGLLFNIMPCVLPVLPLKAIGFYEVSQHHRSKSLALGLVFSLGLISVFAVLAIFVLVLKQFTWGELFSKGLVCLDDRRGAGFAGDGIVGRMEISAADGGLFVRAEA